MPPACLPEGQPHPHRLVHVPNTRTRAVRELPWVNLRPIRNCVALWFIGDRHLGSPRNSSQFEPIFLMRGKPALDFGPVRQQCITDT